MACYLVTPQDNEVAKYVEGWTGRTVARLRGMYETQKGKALDISDAAKAAKILSGLRRKLLTQHIDRSSTNMIEAFRSLRSAMSAGTRYNRIRMLTTMFASELDRIQLREPNLTRQQIANSVENSDGTVQYGQSYIFDAIFSRLLKARKAYSDAGDEYKANEISKVLDNFGALCAYTKVALRDTEGFKLGSRIGFAASTTPEDFGDNDLSAWFDPEAHTRESWQESTDMTSAFSSLSDAVRRVISTLKATDEHGNVLKDDLGIPMYVNPITTHQSLVEELAGIPLREDDMVQRIKDSSLPFAKQLVQILANNNQVRTQFCCELCRCNQLYGDVAYEHLPNGTIKTKTRILNKLRNLLTGNYTTRVMMGKSLSPHSVYSDGGKINWANVQALRQYIKDNFIGEATEGGTIFDKTQAKNGRNTPFGKASVNERAGMLMHVMQALGIDLDTETAVKLANSNDLFYNINTGMVRNIRGLILGADGTTPTGIDALLTSSDIKALEAGDYSKLSRKEKTFRQLLKAKTSTQAKLSKQGNVQEVVNRLLDNIATKREAYRVESRCTVRDKKGKTKTLYSHVAPSYMGTFIERINAYAGANNQEAIRQFIREKFLDSSMFVDDNGRILNRWMYDLYNENLDGKSFAELMTYHRFIGEANLEFEDFTSKQHAISMMHEYFFADNLTDSEGRKYANYPVFILGDSGVCKFIRAKRYEAQEILDGMYDIYLAEMRRNKLIEAANNQLISEGKKPIDNTTTKDGKTDTSFKMLPFLEDENYRPEGDPVTWTKEQVQTAIRKYMRQAVKDFKANIARLGLLDKTSTGEYRYFSDVMGEFYGKDSNGQRLNTPEAMEEAFNKMLANYFWNTKFATLQQFQLMTIDVAFYKSTKDLQKRYKEIHAPGRPASIQAKDFDGNYYCGVDRDGNLDPVETCVYFDDPKINAENSNPEFMSALLIQYAAPGMREEAIQAVKDGILTPKPEGSAEENARISRLKKILGKNFDTYDAYRSNVLADGQGYRTLKSYRKIMGMLGEWTREMENAYHLIEGIRAQYGEDANLPTEVIDQISELSIVFQPIKPYMFTIEKFPMNDNGGTLNIPVQHKYAEAVLIPELLPAGSMLRHMALWMDQNNIDLAGAWSKGGDKIVKVGGYGSASLAGVSDRESLNSALNTATVHRLNYEDYRKQTNVPEHINCSRLFGTQLRKLIMAGVDMNKIYDYLGVPKVNLMGSMTELTGRNLINFYNSLIVANILDSYEELAKEVSDPSKLADILQQAIINNSRQSLDNLLAFALEDGKFAMPLFEGGMEHDTSAMLLSIFKDRVNKQKIQGGAAVQVSAMGIKGYEEAGDLAYVGTDANGNIVRSNDVSANPIVNTLYAEIEVPFDFTVNVWDEEKGTYVTKDLKYSDYCNEDGTFIMSGNTTLIEKRFPGILDRVLYRIPTERDYSMIRGKIVRCSPKMAGGTIKVPAQGTTQAGFDFDIDKLYYHMREYYCKPNKFADILGEALASQLKTQEIGEALLSVIDDPAEYDVTKSVLEQDADPRVARAVRNNMLLTLIEKRLEDPDTFLQRTQPGGFADHSFAAREMRELLYADEDEITGGKSTGTKVEYWHGYWNRQHVAAQTDKVFLFGDNTEDRTVTHYVPSSTQAVIRGLPNAIGIDTKKNRGTNEGGLSIDITNAEFYSGAAIGADQAWEEAAKKAGVKVKTYTVQDWDKLSDEWKETLNSEYLEVVKMLGRKELPKDTYSGKLVRRDMMQADKADAIFAIGTVASNGYVDGGTGYATTRGILRGIPVYLFDQKDNTWKIWRGGKFINTTTPALTKNAAVIGTRQLQDNGKSAINSLFSGIGSSYFTDADFDTFKAQVDAAIQKAKDSGKTIVIPADGIGTGKAQLKERAPKCFAYLQEQLSNLGKSVNVGSGHVNFDAIERRSKQKSLDPEPNYDPSDPFTIITYNQMNQVAGKLIGIFANQNTNHAFASLMKTFKLKKPLSFCGHSYNDLLHAPEGTDPALNIAECLSASVDAVKDPVLNYLNFNTITADAGGLLARLGYTGFEIGLLFNQQCVKEACELAFNEGLPIDIAIRKIESNYTDIAQKTVDQSSDNTALLSKQSLANMLLESRRNTESGHMPSVSFAERQLAVLSFFREVLDAAGEVSNFVTTTKFTASNSVGSTFGDMYAQQLKVKKYIESFGGPKQKVEMEVTAGINTPIGLNMDKGSKEEYMRNLIVGERNMGNPFAYEQAMYDMNVRFVQSMAKYFPYETTNYRDARELAAALTRGQTLDAGTINDIHSEMLSYILSRQDGYFNGNNMHLDKNHPEEVMTHREYYLNVFPRKIAELLEQEPELKEQYAIFQYMLLETTEDEFGNDILELKLQDVGGLSSTQKDAIRDSWSDLAEDVLGVNTEENISPLARDLFLYCYYKAGFEFSPKSFMHLAPIAVKERIIVNKEGVTYKQLLDRILEGGNATTPILVDQERFIKTFIANHTDNYRFTYKVRRGDAATDLDSTIIRSAGSGQLAESFTLSRRSLGEDVQLFINGTWAKTGHCTEWIPAILVGNALYMANNKGTPRFNVSEEMDDSMTYTLAGTIVDGRFYKRVDRTTPEAKKEEMFQPGNADHTESVPEKTEAPKPSKIDIRALAAELVKRMIKRGEVMPEEQDKMVTYYADGLGAAADEDLHQSILDAEANYGKLVDAEGNIIC